MMDLMVNFGVFEENVVKFTTFWVVSGVFWAFWVSFSGFMMDLMMPGVVDLPRGTRTTWPGFRGKSLLYVRKFAPERKIFVGITS